VSARALGTPVVGLCPQPAREKDFPSNLLLNFRIEGEAAAWPAPGVLQYPRCYSTMGAVHT
jgi:hypothetical protein